MGKVYREGKPGNFGVSNYSAKDVEHIVEICQVQGWIKPTVYQGRYDAIIRSREECLFSPLRKQGMGFYA